MPGEITVELIRLIPMLLWFTFALVAFILFYRRIRDDVLPRLGGIEFFGVTMTLVREELNRVIDEFAVPVKESAAERAQVIRRARRLTPLCSGARLLWVDDQPENNAAEQRIFASLGILVDQARSNDEALKMLSFNTYDLLISDMQRDSRDAGLHLLKIIRQRGYILPLIFYISHFDPARGTPPYAFGITNRATDLLNYIFDALERRRG